MAGEEKKKNRKPKQEPGPQPVLQVNALTIWREPRVQRPGQPPPPGLQGLPGPARLPGLQQVDAAPPGHRGFPGRSPPRAPNPDRASLTCHCWNPNPESNARERFPLTREGQKVPLIGALRSTRDAEPSRGSAPGRRPARERHRRSLTLGAVVNAVELPVRGQSLHRHHLGASLSHSPNQPG